VRKGEFVTVGLGRLDPRSLPAATNRFVACLEANRKIPPHVAWRWRGHSYAVHTAPYRRIVDAGVLLVGDAAGMADPQSGEGIRQAIETGLLAGETIIEARGRFSRECLEPYAAAVRARFPVAPLADAIARVVPDGVKAIVATRLLRVPAFVRRVVVDEWFLHRSQPALVC
jgi:flavin-dependent dehydrogenase